MARIMLVVAGVALLLPGVAAPTPAGGRIVFSTFLPQYPLPNNFEVERTWLLGPGTASQELEAGAVLSPNGAHVAAVRGGTELWLDGRRAAAPGAAISDVVWSPDSRRVAFVAAEAGWIVGLSDTAPQQILAPPTARVRWQAWSPDDETIAVAGVQGLWLVAAAGGTPPRSIWQPLTTPIWAGEAAESIAWSPTSDAFVLTIDTSIGCGPGIFTNCFDWYLAVYDAAGERVGTIRSAWDAAWSPDGRRFAFTTGYYLLEPDQLSVATADARGQHQHWLTPVRKFVRGNGDCWETPSWLNASSLVVEEDAACDYATPPAEVGFVILSDAAPSAVRYRIRGRDHAFTRDGRSIAFRRGDALFTMQLGATPHAVPTRGAVVGAPQWSADGRILAFTVARTRTRELDVVARGSTRVRTVVRLNRNRTLVAAWYGSRLTYTSELRSSSFPRLWSVRPDGSGLRRVAPGRDDDVDPAWSPDGARLAVSHRYGLETMRPDGHGVRHLVGVGAYVTNPSWSPDGREIVYSNADGLSVVAEAGGPSRRLTPKGTRSAYTSSQAWSPDGTKIVYALNGDVDIIQPDGTGAMTLLQGLAYSGASWSPDGSRLAFNCMGCKPHGVAVVNADGTDLHVVVASSLGFIGGYPDPEAPGWSPDGRQLVFSGTACTAGTDESPPAICVVGIDGSGLRALTPVGIGAFAPTWTAHA